MMLPIQTSAPVRFQGQSKVDPTMYMIMSPDFTWISSFLRANQEKIEALPPSVMLKYQSGPLLGDTIQIAFNAGSVCGKHYVEGVKRKRKIPFVRAREAVDVFIDRAIERATKLASDLKAQ